MSATISVLNVGQGDLKISFDKGNEAEKIRAARIIKDMLRRGYALLVEVERDGCKAYERALGFDEEKAEYIIADLDTEKAERVDEAERVIKARQEREAGNGEGESIEAGVPDAGEKSKAGARRGRPRKGVPISTTNAVAVASSAGG